MYADNVLLQWDLDCEVLSRLARRAIICAHRVPGRVADVAWGVLISL